MLPNHRYRLHNGSVNSNGIVLYLTSHKGHRRSVSSTGFASADAVQLLHARQAERHEPTVYLQCRDRRAIFCHQVNTGSPASTVVTRVSSRNGGRRGAGACQRGMPLGLGSPTSRCCMRRCKPLMPMQLWRKQPISSDLRVLRSRSSNRNPWTLTADPQEFERNFTDLGCLAIGLHEASWKSVPRYW